MIEVATKFFGWYLLDNKHFSLNSVSGLDVEVTAVHAMLRLNKI